MKILNTVENKILMAKQYEKALTVDSNTYIGIGKPLEWDGSDTVIPRPTETTDNIFDVYRHLVSLKKIIGSDVNLVAPRVDWANNTVYEEYTEDLELFTYDFKQQVSGVVTASLGSSNVVGNGTFFTANLSVGDYVELAGDGINVPPVKKEIVAITNNTFMLVNSVFTNTYTQNNLQKIINTYPFYSNKFYVRNDYDQVFKCLLNNNGAASTVVPEIDVGGSLPENPFILTSDGYKWKYLYTIPSGIKEKFFTSDWMPVVKNNLVVNSTVNGRLEIIKIISGGSGYLAGGNSSSANIISVSGSGTGANLTANVYNGVITNINIIDGGSGYKDAIITVSDNTQLFGSNSANIISVIGPENGHGYDPEKELGATHLMICSELDGDELGKFPTENLDENFDFRQVSILRDVLDSDGLPANNIRYNASYLVTVFNPPKRYTLDSYLYQGESFETATYTAVVVFWDDDTKTLWLNNVTGSIQAETELKVKDDVNFVASIDTIVSPEIQLNSGELLYIKNNESIVRDDDQTEQIKILVSF